MSATFTPPSDGSFKGRGVEAQRVGQKILFGYTSGTARCSRCGKVFSYEEIGDTRAAKQAEMAVVLLPQQEDWVAWLLDPVGRECPHLPVGRDAGWTTALKEAARRAP
jgi:hypothetical protein